MIASTAVRNAAGLAPAAGVTRSDRIRPRDAGISSNRHDSPLRSGRLPGGAGGYGEFDLLHRGIGPRQSAAGEHRQRDIVGGGKARHADVCTACAHRRDRKKPDAEC